MLTLKFYFSVCLKNFIIYCVEKKKGENCLLYCMPKPIDLCRISDPVIRQSQAAVFTNSWACIVPSLLLPWCHPWFPPDVKMPNHTKHSTPFKNIHYSQLANNSQQHV